MQLPYAIAQDAFEAVLAWLDIDGWHDAVRALVFFFCQAEDGIRDIGVTGVQTCALPICRATTSTSTPIRISPVRSASDLSKASADRTTRSCRTCRRGATSGACARCTETRSVRGRPV